jgi:regulator of sigma E protease
MSFIWALIGFFLILTPIILVHELGHFVAARYFNIKVEEFGLGFPPRATKLFDWQGTEFTLNWIPLGGFVRPAGEDDPNVEGGLANASKTARFGVLVAGSLFNFIMAAVIFTIVFMMPRTAVDNSLVAIAAIAPNSPAAQANLQIDDIFLSVNGQPIAGNVDFLVEEIRANAGQPVALTILRAGEEQDLTLTPRRPDEYNAAQEGAVGVRLTHPEIPGVTEMMNPIEASGMAVSTIGNIIYTTLSLPVELVRGTVAPEEARVVSIVGISQMAGQATEQTANTGDLSYVLWLMGVISVALGFTNLLPIPALDGGRILFVLIEAVRGRRIEPEQEGMVHAVGMALLLGLMVILIVQDVVNPIILPS